MKTFIISATILFLSFILPQFTNANGDRVYDRNIEEAVDTIVPGRMLSFKDTIYLGVSGEKKSYLIHIAKPAQNLKGLSKYYSISVGDITYLNPGIKNFNILPVGYALKIPIPNKAIMLEDNEITATRWRVVPLLYKVKSGETIFRIARKYFDMPIETLKERNGLLDNTLSPGQVLHIGWMDVKGIPENLRSYSGLSGELRTINKNLKKRYEADVEHPRKKINTEKGIAKWNKKSSRDIKLYALHRTAPNGTVIKVYAPSAKRTLYVKVMGKISRNVHGPDVLLYLSPSAAKALGAVNDRLRVELKYFTY